MSAGILIDWSGAVGRRRWDLLLPGYPTAPVRPADRRGTGDDGAGSGSRAVRSGSGSSGKLCDVLGDSRSSGVLGDSRSSGVLGDSRHIDSEAVVRFPAPPARLLRLDRLALELRVAHDRLARPLARAAAAFLAARAWRACGAARLEDHARERFGRTARWVRQWADLGGALARCPELACALTGDDGGVPLGAEAARLVARVVAADADGDCDALLARWIARAREVPLRVLRAEVRAALARDAGDAIVAVEGEADGAAEGGFPKVAASAGHVAGDPELDDEPRCLVEFRLPAAIRAAFDEVVDLHRALAGRDGSLAEAIDALLAESMSGSLALPDEGRFGTPGVFGATGVVGAPGAPRRGRRGRCAWRAWRGWRGWRGWRTGCGRCGRCGWRGRHARDTACGDRASRRERRAGPRVAPGRAPSRT